jgi:hypothetical protein
MKSGAEESSRLNDEPPQHVAQGERAYGGGRAERSGSAPWTTTEMEPLRTCQVPRLTVTRTESRLRVSAGFTPDFPWTLRC